LKHAEDQPLQGGSAAVYYARNVLPAVEFKAKLLSDGDCSPLEVSDGAFSTV